MHVLFGGLLAMALAPSGDPRTIDPAANRPEIVAPGGSPTKAAPVKTRPPKVVVDPKVVPTTDPKVVSKPDPTTDPKVVSKPDPTTDPKVVSKPEVSDAGPQERCFPERGRCWRLNVAGIVAASAGVAALGTGIGFMQAPQFPVPDEPIFNRSLRPPGVVMIAVGAVTAVTGVLMIVAGHASHGKPKRPAQSAGVQLVPGGLRW